MRLSRFLVLIGVISSCTAMLAQAKPEKITVTGTLSRAMAIGAETTGWMIQLDKEPTIAGKSLHSIEIAYPKAEKLEKLANQHVKAKGILSHRSGVETGERTVLEVKSIKRVNAN